MDHVTAVKKNLAFLPSEGLFLIIRACLDELETRGKKV